jgi:transposase
MRERRAHERRVELTERAREVLEEQVRRAAKPYLRERAAAILKVADGGVAARVATEGLLTRHKPDTVYRWLDRYLAEGIAGLALRPGRGRKPALSPPRGG